MRVRSLPWEAPLRGCRACSVAVAWPAVLACVTVCFLVSLPGISAAGDDPRHPHCVEPEALEALSGFGPEGAYLRQLHEARCAMHEGRFAEAVHAARRPQPGLRAVEQRRLQQGLAWWPELDVRVLLHEGDAQRAIQRVVALLRGPSDRQAGIERHARLLYLLGLAYEMSGDQRRARATYRRLLAHHPGSEVSSRLLPMSWEPALRADEMVRRSELARDQRNYPTAEAWLRRALCAEGCRPADVPDPEHDAARYEAAWQLGFLLYRFRREHVADAIPWLRALAALPGPRQQDAQWTLGLALQRLQDHAGAREAFAAFAEAWPGEGRVAEGAYLSAVSHLAEANPVAALPALEAFVERFPRAQRAEEARWWWGWALYQEGRCEGALGVWSSMGRTRRRLAEQQRLYWSGVCQAQRGQREIAERLWREVMDAAPLSWYGWWAARRMGVTLPPASDGSYLRPSVGLRAQEPVVLLARSGLFIEAQLLGVDAQEDALALPVERLIWRSSVIADREAWRRDHAREGGIRDRWPLTQDEMLALQRVYPPIYGELVRVTARRSGVPPALLWSVMLQESAFDAGAISVSDAMGLMQVIPQTAVAIAASTGETYSDGMLFAPRHALRYGAWYLQALATKYGGQWPLAVLAYNAGPVAVSAWVDRWGGAPLDAFVEHVVFDQARNYVRGVWEHLLRYDVVWDTEQGDGAADLGRWFPTPVVERYLPEPSF